MFKFDPPANVNDLSLAQKSRWSAVVHQWFKDAENRLKDDHGQSSQDIRLYNLLDTPAGPNAVTVDIPWSGFPRKYKLVYSDLQERWQQVEQIVKADLTGRQASFFKQLPNGNFVRADNMFFRDQDEYCEWHSFRNSTGELIKVVFTCENPEYWRFIADNDSDILLDLYNQMSDGQVQKSDLLFNEDIFVPGANREAINLNGKYNPLNKWNTSKGAIHLTHPANSLSAEIYLAADATILRKNSYGPVTSPAELICCSSYGGPDRASDPTIGGAINGLVQQGLSVSINNPVGLYIHSLDPTPFEFPSGIDFDDCWNIIRGDKSKNQILRAEFALPDSSPLSEVSVGGEPLEYGAQIADLISLVIFGIAFDSGSGISTSHWCVGHCCVNPDFTDLQQILPLDQTCPPLDAPVPFKAAPVPQVMELENLNSIEDAFTR